MQTNTKRTSPPGIKHLGQFFRVGLFVLWLPCGHSVAKTDNQRLPDVLCARSPRRLASWIITALTDCNTTIRQDSEGCNCLNDLYRVCVPEKANQYKYIEILLADASSMV